MFVLFIKGLIIGIVIAAPVGPIGVLCIQRSLHDGFKVGLMTGLGAAIADGTYGVIAGFGFTALSDLLVAQQFWIRLLGGFFLLYLGIKLFSTQSVENTKDKSEQSSWHALVTTYLLTMTNPATVLSFLAIFSGLGLSQTTADYAHAMALVLGITLGSALWWLILSGGVALVLHHRISPSVIRRINKISGIIIVSFGIYSLSMK